MARGRKSKGKGKQRGSLYFSEADQRWVAALVVDDEGKRVRRYVKGPRGDGSEEAKMAVDEALSTLKARKAGAAPKGTVASYMSAWLAAKKPNVRGKTYEEYEGAIRRYISPRIGSVRLAALKKSQIEDLYASIVEKPATRKSVHKVLHAALADAFRDDVINVDVASKLKAPRLPHREKTVLSAEETLFFLKHAASDHLFAVYVLAVTTGMGPAELFGLQRRDLHLDDGYLEVNRNLEEVGGIVAIDDVKVKSRLRKIALPAIAVDALRAYLAQVSGAPQDPVFKGAEGGPIRPNNFRSREWNPLLERIADKAEEEAHKRGIRNYVFPRIKFYELRHTANSIWRHLRVPIAVIKDRMGHSSIRHTVDTYGKEYDSADREVATRMDDFFAALNAQDKVVV